MRKPLVVNLFGVPSAGKSTGAAYVFAMLKMNGVNAELITEVAKDKVWEDNKEAFKNQAYLFGKQSFRISRCKEKVDVIVTDSPLLLSVFYNQDKILGDTFNETVYNTFTSYNNLNFLIDRVKEYNPIGRIHSEKESNNLKKPMFDLLSKYSIPYTTVNGDIDGYQIIINNALKELGK